MRYSRGWWARSACRVCVRREGGREREDARVNALDAPTRRERERKGGKGREERDRESEAQPSIRRLRSCAETVNGRSANSSTPPPSAFRPLPLSILAFLRSTPLRSAGSAARPTRRLSGFFVSFVLLLLLLFLTTRSSFRSVVNTRSISTNIVR